MKFITEIESIINKFDNKGLELYYAIDETNGKVPVCENMTDYMNYYYPVLLHKYDHVFVDKAKTALGKEYEIVRKEVMKHAKIKAEDYVIVRFVGSLMDDEMMIYDSLSINESVAKKVVEFLSNQGYVLPFPKCRLQKECAVWLKDKYCPDCR